MKLPTTKSRIGATVIGIVVVAIIVVFFPRKVYYTEISNRDLSLRYRNHYEIPHLNIRFAGNSEIEENELSRYLTNTNQLLTGKEAEIWLPVRAYKFGMSGSGSGIYLHDALFQDEHLVADIVKWSKENPEEARVFWAEISEQIKQGDGFERAYLLTLTAELKKNSGHE